MPLPEFRLSTLALTLRELSKMAMEGSLTLDAPYQRGSVWTLDQRVALIKSLLMGIPVPAIILNRRGANLAWGRNEGDSREVWYAAIDGKQRITTGVMWFTGDFSVPTAWLDERCVPDGYVSERITYLDLTPAGTRFMGQNFVIPVAEASLGSLEDEAEVYGLVNLAGTPQTEEDLARARAVARGGGFSSRDS